MFESADLLLNVSGVLDRPEDYLTVGRLAYIDGDPVFTQAGLAAAEADLPSVKERTRKLQLSARVDAHDVHFTLGERLAAAPTTGHEWKPTRQPIVLSEWHRSAPFRDAYTTVMSWTSYRPVRVNGRVYAQKDVEFARFVDLPALVPSVKLEIALGATRHADWESAGPDALSPPELLRRRGWHVVSAGAAGGDLDRYRTYVESSKAEWTVAKNGYVLGRPGWFGCRSACYLAAGRPVVVQDTGFGDLLPVGEGILTFETPEQAAAALVDVDANYERHARAARMLAEEYFDSDKVLSLLLEEAMR